MDNTPIIAAASGVAVHLTAFVHGEWHVQAPLVFRTYTILFILLVFLSHLKLHNNIMPAISTAVWLLTCHVAGLFVSLSAYRLIFHPLRHFPGPLLARTTKLWHVWHCRTSRNHLFLEGLRQKHGDFVRTGPNEITIFHPDGLALVNKTEDVDRSDWYDLVHPAYSVNTVRDPTLHDMRRKVFESAFTSKAMKDYEHRIRQYAINVEASLRHTRGVPVNMNALVYRFAYSVMSDLAFGQEMDESDDGWQRAVRTMHTGLSILGPLSPAPWIALLFFSFTWLPLVRDWNAMMDFCSSKMAERVAKSMQTPPKSRDIAAWLIEDAQSRGQLGTAAEKRWLDGDGFAVILAGSDTTASTLVHIFHYLAKNPEYQARVRMELSQLSQDADVHLVTLTFKDFERLPFLNALINETLRLHHPLPTAGGRVIRNPRGISIGEHHIPCGTNVIAPRWSYGRCEAHYGRAQEFIPERWLKEADLRLVPDKRVFTPWLGGKWSCLGKPVALFEMRYLVSVLVKNFVISLAGEDMGSAVENDYKDQVTAFPGRLTLKFEAEF